MNRVDLHTHSTFSDGTLTPAELVKLAHEKKLLAIALTDHDSISGLAEAETAAQEAGIELINGVELSTYHLGREYHILGLFIDKSSVALQEAIDKVYQTRVARNQLMLQRFAERGIILEIGHLDDPMRKKSITRAHFAQELIRQGYCQTVEAAIKTYLSNGCETYIERDSDNLFSLQATIEIIKAAEGIPILAHPLSYKLQESQVEPIIQEFQSYGLEGIEVYYSTHSPEDTTFLYSIAKKNHLKISGGSDFHGTNKPHIQLGTGTGKLRIPYDIVTKLKYT